MVVNRMVFDLILVVSFASVCVVLAKGMALVFIGNINELFIYLLWTGTSSILLAGILFYFGRERYYGLPGSQVSGRCSLRAIRQVARTVTCLVLNGCLVVGLAVALEVSRV